MDCIFCKIANHTLSKNFLYEDSEIMVFSDINPIKPIHLLIVPKKHIQDFMVFRDNALLSKIRDTIQDQVFKNKLENRGFRIVVNGGGAQVIDHLHFHLSGPWGRKAKI